MPENDSSGRGRDDIGLPVFLQHRSSDAAPQPPPPDQAPVSARKFDLDLKKAAASLQRGMGKFPRQAAILGLTLATPIDAVPQWVLNFWAHHLEMKSRRSERQADDLTGEINDLDFKNKTFLPGMEKQFGETEEAIKRLGEDRKLVEEDLGKARQTTQETTTNFQSLIIDQENQIAQIRQEVRGRHGATRQRIASFANRGRVLRVLSRVALLVPAAIETLQERREFRLRGGPLQERLKGIKILTDEEVKKGIRAEEVAALTLTAALKATSRANRAKTAIEATGLYQEAEMVSLVSEQNSCRAEWLQCSTEAQKKRRQARNWRNVRDLIDDLKTTN